MNDDGFRIGVIATAFGLAVVGLALLAHDRGRSAFHEGPGFYKESQEGWWTIRESGLTDYDEEVYRRLTDWYRPEDVRR